MVGGRGRDVGHAVVGGDGVGLQRLFHLGLLQLAAGAAAARPARPCGTRRRPARPAPAPRSRRGSACGRCGAPPPFWSAWKISFISAASRAALPSSLAMLREATARLDRRLERLRVLLAGSARRPWPRSARAPAFSYSSAACHSASRAIFGSLLRRRRGARTRRRPAPTGPSRGRRRRACRSPRPAADGSGSAGGSPRACAIAPSQSFSRSAPPRRRTARWRAPSTAARPSRRGRSGRRRRASGRRRAPARPACRSTRPGARPGRCAPASFSGVSVSTSA